MKVHKRCHGTTTQMIEVGQLKGANGQGWFAGMDVSYSHSQTAQQTYPELQQAAGANLQVGTDAGDPWWP